MHATWVRFPPTAALTWLWGETVMFPVRATNRAIPARFDVYCRGGTIPVRQADGVASHAIARRPGASRKVMRRTRVAVLAGAKQGLCGDDPIPPRPHSVTRSTSCCHPVDVSLALAIATSTGSPAS